MIRRMQCVKMIPKTLLKMLQPCRLNIHILVFTFKHVKKSCCRSHDLIVQYISYIFFIKKSALETNKTGNLEHVPTFKTEGLSIEPSQRTATKKRIFIGLIFEPSNYIKLRT